jgi:hypothetical protein
MHYVMRLVLGELNLILKGLLQHLKSMTSRLLSEQMPSKTATGQRKDLQT